MDPDELRSLFTHDALVKLPLSLENARGRMLRAVERHHVCLPWRTTSAVENGTAEPGTQKITCLVGEGNQAKIEQWSLGAFTHTSSI